MEIAFYVNNLNFQQVNCLNLIEGNPGIGGTWYIILVVACELHKRYSDLSVRVYVNTKNENLPNGPTYIEVKNAVDAIKHADSENVDYFILNYYGFDWKNFDYESLSTRLSLIPWCHNFVEKQCKYLDLFFSQKKIGRVINVGREQMDLYLDHPVYRKMDYIYNCVPIDKHYINKCKNLPFSERKHIVTYVGSLVPQKCFHVLASVWQNIVNAVPDAELYVIGSGNVYNHNAKLGKYNIADELYENQFMKYLIDEEGKILSSVHFMGNLGTEKYEILLKTKVGVPNPLGLTETFCISAVEMQALGCVVTALQAPGYYDTFFNGKIVDNKKQLIDSIIYFLKTDVSPHSYQETIDFLNDNFSIDSVLNDWYQLFSNFARTWIHPIKPLKNKKFHLKYIKNLIGYMRFKYRIPWFLKNLEYYYFQYDRIKRRFIEL